MNKEQVDFKESLSYFLEPCNYTLGKFIRGSSSIAGGLKGARYSITPVMGEEEGALLVSDLILSKSVIMQEWVTLKFHAGDFFENPHIPTEEEINLFLLTNKDMADFMVYTRNYWDDRWGYST